MLIFTLSANSYHELIDGIDEIKEELMNNEELVDININPVISETQTVEYADKTITKYKYNYICNVYVERSK